MVLQRFSTFTTLFSSYEICFPIDKSFLWLFLFYNFPFWCMKSVHWFHMYHSQFGQTLSSCTKYFSQFTIFLLVVENLLVGLLKIFHGLEFHFWFVQSLPQSTKYFRLFIIFLFCLDMIFLDLPKLFDGLQLCFWVWKVSSSVYQTFSNGL